MSVLGQVVHLHEVVAVLEPAEDGVFLAEGPEAGVGVVPGVLLTEAVINLLQRGFYFSMNSKKEVYQEGSLFFYGQI